MTAKSRAVCCSQETIDHLGMALSPVQVSKAIDYKARDNLREGYLAQPNFSEKTEGQLGDMVCLRSIGSQVAKHGGCLLPQTL